jgi:hypothetical protein
VTVDLLLHAVESGAVDFDELIPECERRWQYYTDWARRSLARFDADDDGERDGLAVGWIWVASTDTWRIKSRANYEVFLPGRMWEDVEPGDVCCPEGFNPRVDRVDLKQPPSVGRGLNVVGALTA